MMATESSSLINYYEILNCDPSDSIEDIKKSYQQLILKHHPDKKLALNSMNSTSGDDSNSIISGGSCSSSYSSKTSDIEAFHRIDSAWKLLRDPEQRKKYDAEMQQHRFNDEPIVHANCQRNDFEFDTETQSYIYPCRCGGFFVLPDEFTTELNNCVTSEMDSTSRKQTSDDDDDEIYIECDECSFVVRLISDKR